MWNSMSSETEEHDAAENYYPDESAFEDEMLEDHEPEYWDSEIWEDDLDPSFDEGVHSCRPDEGPPAPLPDPEGRGLHPLVYRGTSRRRSRNPTVGDAQELLNEFLARFDSGRHRCISGTPSAVLMQLRASVGSTPIAVDCRFGPITEAATRLFQACTFADRNQWDGKIGPVTWPPLELMRVALPRIPPVTPPPVTPPPVTPPPVTPPPVVPTVPPDIQEIVRQARRILGGLPLGRIGIVLPTSVRFLTAGEVTLANTVYSGSIDFTKVLISDGLGGGGRAFTTYVPSSVGDFIVMNMGPGPFGTPLSDRRLLIHELAHAWQSQHHPSSPSAFMTNSVLSQGRALADKPIAKAAAAARATAAAVRRGIFSPSRLAAIGNAAAAAEDTSAYAYVPGRSFGQYAAEQIAEQVEHSFMGTGSPTPAVIAHIRALSPHAPSTRNATSLATSRWERKSTPGVVF